MKDSIDRRISKLSELFDKLWNPMTDDQRKIIDHSVRMHMYNKSENIYEIGVRPSYIMYIVSGRIKIQKNTDDGNSKILRIFTPGQFFGYRAYFANEAYTSQAVAMEDSQIVLFPVNIMSELVDGNKSVMHYFLRELAKGLGMSDDRVVSMVQKHLRGRLAETLLFIARSFGTDKDGWIKGHIKRSDLANLANMTTSNAIRTLAQFRKENIIDTSGKRIRIKLPDAMRYISSKE